MTEYVTEDGVKIRLAGYNVPIDPRTNELERGRGGTPEAITAAYARISRSPKTIEDLRTEAIEDVDRARRSNERIVYEYGHGSIAEHAVFNVDVEGISRLGLEILESHRLASYTERSQRYVTLDVEDLEKTFLNAHDEHFRRVYREAVDLYVTLLDRGVSREDARYFLPLGVRGQVGVTMNAREAEYVIRSLLASPLKEVQRIGRGLFEILHQVAPSLIKYVTPSDYDRMIAVDRAHGLTWHNLRHALKNKEPITVHHEGTEQGRLWTLDVHVPSFAVSGGRVDVLELWTYEKVPRWRETHEEVMFDDLTVHDSLPRIFEFIDFTFAMELSASAFAQLKRHRTTSLLPGVYTNEFTFPPSVRELMERDDAIKDKVNAFLVDVAEERERTRSEYLTLQGHRRIVLWKTNGRALANFLRLRLDSHAQWDIRGFAREIYKEVMKHLVNDDLHLLFLGKDVASSYLRTR